MSSISMLGLDLSFMRDKPTKSDKQLDVAIKAVKKNVKSRAQVMKKKAKKK